MKISTRVRYGIKALTYIVEAGKKGKLVRIKEISEAENISIQYLEQILFKLKNEKIIEGKRGPSGGYKIIKEPSEIT
ncbi:MAG: RrF2 family transcriptional regulator, partial [Fusobacteriaceae bacterium]